VSASRQLGLLVTNSLFGGGKRRKNVVGAPSHPCDGLRGGNIMLSVSSRVANPRTTSDYRYFSPNYATTWNEPRHSLAIGLRTLISLAPMLGHRLDDRQSVAKGQASALALRFAEESEWSLPKQAGIGDFFVAPLDILPYRRDGRMRFQLLELNGTGIGGLTNMPGPVVEDILASIAEIGDLCDGVAPLVVVASSGREVSTDVKPSHLLHEKLLFVDRIAGVLEQRFGECEILSFDQLEAMGGWPDGSRPAVVLGYSRELVERSVVAAGAPWLFGRKIAALVNDRCLYNLQTAHGALDSRAFLPANRCFAAGADKAVAYRHVNSYGARSGFTGIGGRIDFDVCHCVESLFETVLKRLSRGEQLVIKPSGTGHGDGIEFFFGDEDKDLIADRISRSINIVRDRYGRGAGYPYTVTEYLDAEVIRSGDHPLRGSKFELRVVVYRKGRMLRAVPSIAKVAPERWDPAHPTRGALINNVSASIRGGKSAGADHILPLCHPETMKTLGLDEELLLRLCQWATGYVAHVLAENWTGAGMR
jgi:hypothetical protein